MAEGPAALDREGILAALTDVGRRLEARGLQGDLYLVGGAAMALAYDTRRTTADVDAVFEPKQVIYEAARAVAAERGWSEHWLNDAVNDAVKGFFLTEDPSVGPVFDLPGLRVQAASPSMLLALKVVAHRVDEDDEDDEDVRTLAGILGLASAEAVLDHVEGLVGRRHLTAHAQFFVEAVMGEP